jgi:membrane-associated phospholipid phosphatase
VHHAAVVTLRKLATGLALAGGAAAIGLASARPLGSELDQAVFADVNAGHGPAADRFFAEVTELGSLYAAGAAAGALAVAGRRNAAMRALGAAGATWLAGQALKKLVDRPRPYHADTEGTRRMIAEPQGTSWPSSHPAVLTAFTRTAGRELGLGRISLAALTGLDMVVAASRVYLGVHYPSDVGGGLLMGRAIAAVWPGGRGRGARARAWPVSRVRRRRPG